MTFSLTSFLLSLVYAKTYLILQTSRRSDQQLAGRNDNNIKVVIPRYEIPEKVSSSTLKEVKPGDYVCVYVSFSKRVYDYQNNYDYFHS